MAWERGYYYRVYRVDGEVVREYCGGGVVGQIHADCDAVMREERRDAIAASRALIAELDTLDATVATADEALELATHAVLVAAGFRQHKRGEWRRRRAKKPNEQSVSDSTTEQERVAALFKRARNGDESVVPAVREALRDPVTLEMYGNLALRVRAVLVGQLAGQDLGTQNAVIWKMEQVRAELAGPDPTPLESLAVDRAITSWLHVHTLEMRYGNGSGLRRAAATQYQGCLSRANARYLAALKALAVIRKLAVPTLQFNIAQNQVNIGNVESAPQPASDLQPSGADQSPPSTHSRRRLPG